MKTTKMLLLAAGLLFSAGAAKAQAATGEEVLILVPYQETNTGLFITAKGMPQMSWMPNRDDVKNDNYETLTKFGAAFGIGTGFVLDENIALEFDLLYSIQGTRYRLNNITYDQKLNYLKLPLLFSYSTAHSNVRLCGKIGPQLSLLTLANIDQSGVSNGDVHSNMDKFENAVIGGVLSTGITWAINKNLSVDAAWRLDVSFTHVENRSYTGYPQDRPQTYNLVTGLEFGFYYLLPRKG